MNMLLQRIIVFIVILSIVFIILIALQPISQQTKYTRMDLILIKNYIMKKTILNEKEIEYYDINKDNKVNSSDYVLIKNQIKEDKNANTSKNK